MLVGYVKPKLSDGFALLQCVEARFGNTFALLPHNYYSLCNVWNGA
jgi:hypothetical protein